MHLLPPPLPRHVPPPALTRCRLLGAVAAWPALAAPAAVAADQPLLVGGLPVTCNLTLPVACVAKAASGSAAFEYSKYNGWPEIKESLMTGRIQAAYMLAPLVMDLKSAFGCSSRAFATTRSSCSTPAASC